MQCFQFLWVTPGSPSIVEVVVTVVVVDCGCVVSEAAVVDRVVAKLCVVLGRVVAGAEFCIVKVSLVSVGGLVLVVAMGSVVAESVLMVISVVGLVVARGVVVTESVLMIISVVGLVVATGGVVGTTSVVLSTVSDICG